MAPAETPFLVLGLPRSRTFWASRYLGAHGRRVEHDIMANMTTTEDLRRYFARPGAAAVDTTLGYVWEGAVRLLPHVRLALITRPVDEIIRSFAKLGLAGDAFEDWVQRYSDYFNTLVASRPCHVTSFAELGTDTGAGALFEYCHGMPADPKRWKRYNAHNLQADFVKAMRVVNERVPEMTALLAAVGRR